MTRVSYNQLTETCGDPIVIISHPRSGTHLTIDLLRKQFPECASYKWPLEPQHYLYLSIEGFLEKRPGRRLKEQTALRIIRRPRRPIIKLHTYSWKLLHERFPEWMRWIERRGKMIYVYRDVHAVMLSYYHYAQTFEDRARVPLSDFLRQSFCGRKNRPAYWKEMMDLWSKKDVMQVDYTDIIHNTAVVLDNIGNYLELKPLKKQPLLPEKVSSLAKYRWQRLIAFRPESSAILGMKSNASSGGNNVLTKADLEFIKSEVENQ